MWRHSWEFPVTDSPAKKTVLSALHHFLYGHNCYNGYKGYKAYIRVVGALRVIRVGIIRDTLGLRTVRNICENQKN